MCMHTVVCCHLALQSLCILGIMRLSEKLIERTGLCNEAAIHWLIRLALLE